MVGSSTGCWGVLGTERQLRLHVPVVIFAALQRAVPVAPRASFLAEGAPLVSGAVDLVVQVHALVAQVFPATGVVGARQRLVVVGPFA